MSNNIPTIWTMVFTPLPGSQGQPNVDRLQGQHMSLSIRVVDGPVPNSGEGMVLPPRPKLLSLSVEPIGDFPASALTVTQPDANGNGGLVSLNLNSNSIYPFQSIRLLMQDHTTRDFKTQVEVENFYNQTPKPVFLVTSCVPVDARYVYYSFRVRATTTSTVTTNMTGVYWIAIESVYRQSQLLLLDLLRYSSTYIDAIKSKIPPPQPHTPTTTNSSTRGSNSDLEYPVIRAQTTTTADTKGFKLDDKITNNSEQNKKVIEEINKENSDKDFYDVVTTSLDNRNNNKGSGSITVTEKEDDDCWCDPSLGIDEIKRRIGKWQE